MKTLRRIQQELKCPKGSFNSFGKYKYRSAEQILESVKPLLQKYDALLLLSDEIIQVGNKMFLKASALISDDEGTIEVFGYAEMGEHKGMSSEQCTGTASSYARKYALNGLFLIDETESDPDSKDNKKAEKIDSVRFEKALQAIKDGDFTIEQLQAKFELTELQQKALLLL
jgi:hypothetical protein